MKSNILQDGKVIGYVEGTTIVSEDDTLTSAWENLTKKDLMIFGGDVQEQGDMRVDHKTQIAFSAETVNLYLFELITMGYEVEPDNERITKADLPNPTADEHEQAFMDRCVGFLTEQGAFEDSEKRTKICMQQYKQSLKKSSPGNEFTRALETLRGS